jgi:hypothetical protein
MTESKADTFDLFNNRDRPTFAERKADTKDMTPELLSQIEVYVDKIWWRINKDFTLFLAHEAEILATANDLARQRQPFPNKDEIQTMFPGNPARREKYKEDVEKKWWDHNKTLEDVLDALAARIKTSA